MRYSGMPAAVLSSPIIQVLVVALSALFLITCGGGSTTSPEATKPRTLSVSLDVTSATPGARIAIHGIPEDVDWAFARVTVPGQSAATGADAATAAAVDAGAAVIRRTDTGDELVVPLDPADPMGGGTVQLEVTNGSTITSNLLTLDVDSLAAAPGAFDGVVTKLEALLAGWVAQNGTTEEALRTTPADQLPVVDLPLLLFHTIINHPDNPNSLRAFADGPIPLFDGVDIDRDLLDALTAMSGLDSLLDDKSAFLDTLTAPALPAANLPSVGTAMAAPRASMICIEGPTFDIGQNDCFKLSDVMAYQSNLEFEQHSAAKKVQDDILDIVLTAAGYTKAAYIAWGVANTFWAADKIEDGSVGVYPSKFISDQTDYTADPETFPEDFSNPGHWSDFHVTAASKGWRFDDVVKDAIAKAKGAQGAFDQKTIDGLVGGLAEGKGVKDAVDAVKKEVQNAVYDQIKVRLNLDDLTKLEYCPQTWPNIDCTGKPYSEAKSPSLVVDNDALSYEPVQVGKTTLTVQTTPVFGLVTPTGEAKEIETKKLQVFIDPYQATAGTDETIDFTARVENAENTDVEWYLSGPLPANFVPNGNAASVTTPSDPWDPAIVIHARSLSNTGLRENRVNSEPREDSTAIDYEPDELVVSPAFVCLKPNESQPFTVTVPGATSQAVTWSIDPPGAGSFSGNTYTAPGSYMDAIIVTATSVEKPELSGQAFVRVAGCMCAWNASVSGASGGTWGGDFAVWSDPGPGGGGSSITMTPNDTGDDYPTITGFTLERMTAGVTGTFDFNSSASPASGVMYNGGVNTDLGVDSPPQLTVLSNDGTTMEGTIQGQFWRVVSLSPPEFDVISISASFKANEVMSNSGSPCSAQ